MLNKIENFINKNNMINMKEIYQEILDKFYSDKDSSIYKINFVFYDKFNCNPEVLEETKKICEDRIGQTKFRHSIVERDVKCLISDDDVEQCQACHIIPYSETKLNDINNGLLLNYNLHHMFDKNKIGFKYIKSYDSKKDSYQIVLSDEIKNKVSYKNYLNFDNKLIEISKGCKKNLDIRYIEFLENL